jgi:putative RNA 2'-phosphotransferase
MDDQRIIKVSKYLSKHLRHQPERLGLTLAPGGWVSVSELLRTCANHQFPLTRDELNEVVAQNDKQRFSFDPTGELIRANQGHSVEIDLQLEPAAPPAVLYHGTSEKFVEAILLEGLRKMSRHHVHLSTDVETARKVGSRHGRPVVFQVDTQRMQAEGHLFYCSANGVWLVDHVSPQYLQRL